MSNYEKYSPLLELCHKYHDTGKVSGSGGNVSILIDGKMVITPTGVSLGDLKIDSFVEVNMDGTYSGNVKPSKEYLMHLKCYENRPDITSVVHVHSLYSVALSCIIKPGAKIPVYFPGYALRVGYLPSIPYYRPGSIELAESVGNIIKERNSVLLCNHGIVSVGQTIEQANNIMEEIEENSQIYMILNGKGNTLSDDEIHHLYKPLR